MTINDKQQTARGVALISVMVVVAVVAASAGQLLYRQNIDIERSTRIMSREQAFLFAFGLETYARDLLARDATRYDYEVDFSQYQEEDGLIEVWSWPIPNQYMNDEWLNTLRRAGASQIGARLRDLSGLFNLNGVHAAVISRPKGKNPTKWELMYEQTFKNLINTSFSIEDENSPDADALWNALVDWFDKNDEALDGGAEDEDYLERDPPYLTGQGRMAWPEEIRLVEGFEGRVAERLLPLMSALPVGRVAMNINTAKSELLRRLPGFQDSFPDLVGEIITRRAEREYFLSKKQADGFLGDTGVTLEDHDTGATLKGKVRLKMKDFFSVKSEFFLFTACVRFGRDQPIEVQSLLRRQPTIKGKPNRDKVVVLQRRMGSGYYKERDCRATPPRAAVKDSEGDL